MSKYTPNKEKFNELLNLLPNEYASYNADIEFKDHTLLDKIKNIHWSYFFAVWAGFWGIYYLGDYVNAIFMVISITMGYWAYATNTTTFGFMNFYYNCINCDRKYKIVMHPNNCKNDLQFLYTLIHEFRHCWQYANFDLYDILKMDKQYVSNAKDHNNKLLEQDANLFALRFLQDNEDKIREVLDLKVEIDYDHIAKTFSIDVERPLLKFNLSSDMI